MQIKVGCVYKGSTTYNVTKYVDLLLQPTFKNLLVFLYHDLSCIMVMIHKYILSLKLRFVLAYFKILHYYSMIGIEKVRKTKEHQLRSSPTDIQTGDL
jgi:hypothetical protein